MLELLMLHPTQTTSTQSWQQRRLHIISAYTRKGHNTKKKNTQHSRTKSIIIRTCPTSPNRISSPMIRHKRIYHNLTINRAPLKTGGGWKGTYSHCYESEYCSGNSS